jgi:hypothetical protein
VSLKLLFKLHGDSAYNQIPAVADIRHKAGSPSEFMDLQAYNLLQIAGDGDLKVSRSTMPALW